MRKLRSHNRSLVIMITCVLLIRASWPVWVMAVGLACLPGCQSLSRTAAGKGTSAVAPPAPAKPSAAMLPPLPNCVMAPGCGAHPETCAAPASIGSPRSASSTGAVNTPGWLSELQSRNSELEDQIRKLKEEIETCREARSTAEAALKRTRQDATQLNQELAFWQSEFKRLEQETSVQNQADLESLDELTRMLGELANRRPPPASGATP